MISVDDFLATDAPTHMSVDDFLSKKDTILPGATSVTQSFDTANPVESFSAGRSRDTNFRATPGTVASLPPGNWKVIEALGGAGEGHPGDATNQGYGNKVLVRNADTGDRLIYQHLQDVNVQPGDMLQGGQIGTTGSSGNATGPNLGIEYQNAQGQPADFMSSPYAQYLPEIK